MCQFCMQHGAGKKWYLSAQNYSDKLALENYRHFCLGMMFIPNI